MKTNTNNNTSKYKSNKSAILAFILSLISLLAFFLDGKPPVTSDFFVLLVIVEGGCFFLGPISLIMGIASLVSSKLYVKKYIMLSVAALIISAASFAFFIFRVINAVNSDLCGSNGTWDCTLNTTIQINWHNDYQDQGDNL